MLSPGIYWLLIYLLIGGGAPCWCWTWLRQVPLLTDLSTLTNKLSAASGLDQWTLNAELSEVRSSLISNEVLRSIAKSATLVGCALLVLKLTNFV